MLWRCWLGDRKGIRPVKNWVVECSCLERGADLHVVQLMALPLTVSCFSKIQIGFTFLVPAHLVVPDKGPLNGCVCVCVCVCVCFHWAVWVRSCVLPILRFRRRQYSVDRVVWYRRIGRYRRSKQRRIGYQFLPARRYASAGTSYDPVSVSVKSVLYQNEWTD